MRILARNISAHLNDKVEVSGWVHKIRELGQINFVILRDCSGFIQLVFHEKPQFTHESVLTVKGTVAANDKAPGGVEILPQSVEILALADPQLPLNVNQDGEKYHLDAILDHRFISLRIPKLRAVFQVQSALLKHFSDFMHSQNFFEMKTTKLQSTGAEGGSGLFSVEYFENKVYLAQSPQFYKQAMVSSGLERVFEISHAYRAEKHDTPRHLNEYVSFDIEMAFIQSEHDLIDFERQLLDYVFTQLAQSCADELKTWKATVPCSGLMQRAPVVAYEQAKEILFHATGKKAFDITPEGERLLCDWALKEHGIEAVFINGWPCKNRPFYTHPTPDGLKTLSFDLLFRGLEITTGGVRIHDYSMLLDALPRFGLTKESLGDYPDIFRFGCPPHGGFAIGIERLTQKILGMSNVKEASPFPRDRKRIRP